MNSILFVEDDELFAQTIADFLDENGFSVSIAPTAADALNQSFERPFDLWLLDVRLPDENGMSLLRSLRAASNPQPAIIFTSSDRPRDVIDGFDAGCDDFLRKSCELPELLCRIHAVIRRSYKAAVARVVVGENLQFDIDEKALYLDDRRLELSIKESALAAILVQNIGSTVLFDTIVERLWGCDEEASMGALRVYITRLKKIFGKERIQNVKSVGYRLLKP